MGIFRDPILFDMLHDHALIKRTFDPIPRVGGGGVCRQNIWYNVDSFLILFNLIMLHDHVLKKLSVTF